MLIAVWIASGLLALAYLAAGTLKVLTPKSKLAEKMNWVTSFTEPQVKVIGAIEAAGAVGVILPALTGIAPILTPIAALGLVAVQVGAIVTHVRLGEGKQIIPNIVLLLLAAVVAVARFAGV